MSQAERHAKQEAQQRAAAQEWEDQRRRLAPKPMAVYVASCFPFLPWREVYHSRGAYAAYVRAHPITKTHDGIVQQKQEHA